MASPDYPALPCTRSTLNLLEFRELVSIALDTSNEANRLSDSFPQFQYKLSNSYHADQASSTGSSHSTPLDPPFSSSASPASIMPQLGGSPLHETRTASRLQNAFKSIKRQASAHFRSIKKKTTIAFPAILAHTAQKFSSRAEKQCAPIPEPERAFTPYLPWAHQLEQAQGHAGPSSNSISNSSTSIHSTATVPPLAHSSSNHSISTVTDADNMLPITPVTPSSGFGVLEAVLDKDDDLHNNPRLTSRWSRYTDDADSGFLENTAYFPTSDSPSEYSQSGEAEEVLPLVPVSHLDSHHEPGGVLAEASSPEETSFGPYKIRDPCCSPLKLSKATSCGGLIFPDVPQQSFGEGEVPSRVSRTSSRKTSSGQSAGSKKDWTLTFPLNVLYPPPPQRQTSVSSDTGSIHGKSARVLARLRDSQDYHDESDSESDAAGIDSDSRLGPNPSTWPWPSPPPSPENLEHLKRIKRIDAVPAFDIGLPTSESSPNATVTPTDHSEDNGISKDAESIITDEASLYYSACPGARSSQGSDAPLAAFAI